MPTPPPTSESPTTTTTTAEVHKCQWENCTADAPDPESLYNHLCNDHIGRKSTNNLCLTCKWKDCGTTCAKRDHITSHLRVHTPLKPHVCDVCAKTFKRPQDLKKHEKIHTEEHHIQHRHSKAITVLDPAYSSRVRGTAPPPTPATYLTVDAARAAVAAGAHNRGSVRSTSTSSPPTADEAHTPGSNQRVTPPHVVTSADFPPTYGHPSLPTWEFLRSDPDLSAYRSGKRSHDALLSAGAAVDEFFHDIKKRKYSSTYDAQMAERLSALSAAAFTGHRLASAGRSPPGNPHLSMPMSDKSIETSNINPVLPHPSHPSLRPPRSQLGRLDSADSLGNSATSAAATTAALALASIPANALPGSPEELAIVNNFLVKLGEQIAAGNLGQMHNSQLDSNHNMGYGGMGGLGNQLNSSHLHQRNNSNPFGLSNAPQQNHNSHNFFDANTLAHLGLASIPGLGATNNQGYSLPNPGHGFGTYPISPSAADINSINMSHHNSLYSHAAALANMTPQRPPASANIDYSEVLSSLNYDLDSARMQQQYSNLSDRRASAGGFNSSSHLKAPLSADSPSSASKSSVSPQLMAAQANHNVSLAQLTAATLSGSPHLMMGEPASPSTLSQHSADSPLIAQAGSPSTMVGGNGSSGDGGSPSYTTGVSGLDALLRPSSASSTSSSRAQSTNYNMFGGSHVPTLAPMDLALGGAVRNRIIPLKAAPPSHLRESSLAPSEAESEVKVKVEDELVDELVDDDDMRSRADSDAEEDARPSTSSTTSASSARWNSLPPSSQSPVSSTPQTHFPSRTLPPLYPSIASLSSTRPKVTYPSLHFGGHSMEPSDPTQRFRLPRIRSASEETEESVVIPSISRDPSLSPPAEHGSSTPSSVSHRASSSQDMHVVLPGIADLRLDLPSEAQEGSHDTLARQRDAAMKEEQERNAHVELIRQLLLWVNTEYIKVHGDPWEQEARETAARAESSVKVEPSRDVEMVA